MAIKKRIYYGEYTLQHWIDLILTENITLPEYQRTFVWEENEVVRFINNIKEGIFIPPVIIGQFRINNQKCNLILDGQQRLTSILFAYINKFLDQAGYGVNQVEHADENDDPIEEENKVRHWTFKDIVQLGKDRDTIIAGCTVPEYKDLNFNVSHSFFLKNCLGFCYIVPDTNNEQEEVKFYSSTFRNINLGGKKLRKEESRRSLYFLNNNLSGFFEPHLDEYTVGGGREARTIDFVRYLSILADYKKGVQHFMDTYLKKDPEEYYERYIYTVINDTDDDAFNQFTEDFNNGEFEDDINRLRQNLDNLEIKRNFSSIIEMDMYMFGLIYSNLFLKENIDSTRKDNLKGRIQRQVNSYRRNPQHSKSPSAKKYIKERAKKSIQIYHSYAAQ